MNVPSIFLTVVIFGVAVLCGYILGDIHGDEQCAERRDALRCELKGFVPVRTIRDEIECVSAGEPPIPWETK